MDNTSVESKVCWFEENNENVSWILDRSLMLGKRILFSGLAITSAPLFLPPLMVSAAIGLACSVPCGLFLVSYACTEKLMSTLLPCPTLTFSIENKIKDYEERGNGGDKTEFMWESTDNDGDIVEATCYLPDDEHGFREGQPSPGVKTEEGWLETPFGSVVIHGVKTTFARGENNGASPDAPINSEEEVSFGVPEQQGGF